MSKPVARAATASSPVLRITKAIGASVTRFLTIATNATKIANDVNELNALTEDELAALGTTRSAEIERIFGIHAYQ